MSTFCRLILRVRLETNLGETVKVSGSGFALGHYREEEAIELVTSPSVYPIWFTPRPLLVPRGVNHRYKYALFSGGEFVRWETTAVRERQVLPRGQWMTLEERFGECPVGAPLHQEIEGLNVFSRLLTFEAEDADPAQAAARALRPSRPGGLPGASYPADTPLILVAYALPVRLWHSDSGGGDGGGGGDEEERGSSGRWHVSWNMNNLIARLDSADPDEAMRVTWVGAVTPTMAGVDAFSSEDMGEIEAALRDMRCHPIFVDPALLDEYYLGYCKGVVWPLFHNVDVLDGLRDDEAAPGPEGADRPDGAMEERSWEAYKEVNQLIASEVTALAVELGEDAVVWVHDYHLLLVPQRLKEMCAGAGIPRPDVLLFLHVPFPTSEIFRSLPQGDDLLSGLLEADVVGFHAFDHARHFLNTCKRVKGLSYQSRPGGSMGVEYNGRNVTVVITHVGIKPLELSFEVSEPAVRDATRALRSRYEKKFLICGVDVCQRLSGVALKLLAFERLMVDYPVWRDRVVLFQRVFSPGSRPLDESVSRREIAQLVARINARFPGVVDYADLGNSPPSRRERLALWKASDVLLLTAIREGLNLFPLEFVFAHSESPAVVVASEFSASCRFLNGALQINPWNVGHVASVIDQALMMPRAERHERHKRDLTFVTKRTCSHWSRQVLADLCHAGIENRQVRQHVTNMEQAGMVVAGEGSDFAQLSKGTVADAYRDAHSRVIILDYGGTLVAREKLGLYVKKAFTGVSSRRPNPRMLATLQALCADPRNIVVVISGVGRRHLTAALGQVSGLALAPSSGYFFSPGDGPLADAVVAPPSAPNSPEAPRPRTLSSLRELEDADTGRQWRQLGASFEHEEILPIAKETLDAFTARTNGSVCRYLDNRIAWNYRSCDPEWGAIQASQLALEMESKLANYPVKVERKIGQVEILPAGLHKGIVVKHTLDAVFNMHGAAPDFVMCVGDDSADEVMFTTLYSLMTESSGQQTQGSHQNLVELAASLEATPVDVEQFDANVFTCVVGKKPSNARFYVQDETELEEVLVELGSISASA